MMLFLMYLCINLNIFAEITNLCSSITETGSVIQIQIFQQSSLRKAMVDLAESLRRCKNCPILASQNNQSDNGKSLCTGNMGSQHKQQNFRDGPYTSEVKERL